MHRFPSPRLPIILLLGLALSLLVAGCNQSSGSTEAAASGPANKTQTGGSSAKSNGSEAAVTISNSQFQPAELKVKTGTTVVWTNSDSVGHQIHDDGDGFRSDIIGRGGKVGVEYSRPGRFSYHCHVHPNMKGIIIVE